MRAAIAGCSILALLRPTCARPLTRKANNYKTNSCAVNNCAAFKPMIDQDTNPTQDTEHHLRSGSVPAWCFWHPCSGLRGGLIFCAVVFGLPAILFVFCGDLVPALEMVP